MNEWQRLSKRAEMLREECPVGTRIMLKHMDDIQAPPYGTLGTVRGVDDMGTILVQWDTGSRLGVTEEDEVIKLGTRG